MSNILPILNLNKQPTSVKDRILTDAVNIRFEKDNKTITNLNKISELKFGNDSIKDKLKNLLEPIDKQSQSLQILHILPCNNELIIFANTVISSYIFRYNEKANDVKLNYIDFNYSKEVNSKFSSTFTYNYNNELIIAFCEYDVKEDSPLKTINLGRWEDIDNYEQLDKRLLPICPEIGYFSGELKKAEGILYKGSYTFFIRFKLNDVDYTQWYDLNCFILLDNYSAKNIFDYSLLKNRGTSTPTDTIKKFTAFDYISDEYEIIHNSLQLELDIVEQQELVSNYQLGFICVTKDNKICKRTSDININTTTYLFDREHLYDELPEEMSKSYINYFNVKKLYNYNNKLYIADYKEQNLKYDSPDVIVKLNKKEIEDDYSKEESTYRNLQYSIGECIRLLGDHNIKEKSYQKLKNISNIKQYDLEINRDYGNEELPLIYVLYPFIQKGFIKNNINSIVDTNLKQKWINLVEGKVSLNEIRNDDDYNVDIVMTGSWLSDDINDRVGMWCPWQGTNKNNYCILKTNIGKISIDISNTAGNNFIRLTNIDKKDDPNIQYNGPNLYMRTSYNNPYFDFNKCSIIINENKKFDDLFLDYPEGKASICYTNENNTRKSIFVFSLFNYDVSDNNKMECITSMNVSVVERNYSKQEGIQYNNKNGFLSNSYLEFFIHYVDKYHNISQGIPLNINYDNQDSDITDNQDSDIENNILFIDELKSLYDINMKLNSDKNYFISYCYNKKKTYRGVIKKYKKDNDNYSTWLLYLNDLVLEDVVNLDLNKIIVYNTEYNKIGKNVEENIPVPSEENSRVVKEILVFEDGYLKIIEDSETKEVIKTETDIISINIENSNNENVYNSVCLKINLPVDIEIEDICIVDVYNNVPISLIENVSKKLIPCSKIYKNTINDIKLINGNGYFTINTAIIFADNIYFNSGAKVFDSITENGLPVAAAKNNKWSRIPDILQKYNYYDVQEIPYEYKQFNHAPQKITFPVAGSDSKEEPNKNLVSYVPGQIFESINVIDLYKNIHLPITEAYSKYYTNYREDIIYLSEFTKTIRRSNIIQDESRETSWRFFEANQYKMIAENKGKITNIIGFGDILLVHTEHSLFMFRNQYSLQSDKDEEIALQNNDIWNLKYKEVVTDQLGYGGLQDNKSYIAGQFGYIFYDKDAKTIYKFDEGKFDIISSDIEKYMLINNITNISFGEDKENKIIYCSMFNNGQLLNTFIYDYTNKSFISYIRLEEGTGNVDTNYSNLINTKQTLYCFNKNYFNLYKLSNDRYNKCKFSVIVNTSVEAIKYIESIMYKLRLVKNDKINSFDTFKETIYPYAGDILRIKSEFCDTNDIDLKIKADAVADKYPDNNCIDPSTGRYNSPYFHLGQWNFNTIRDTINKNVYGQEQSRVYGDWFIITFSFDFKDYEKDNSKLEFESLTVNLIEAK